MPPRLRATLVGLVIGLTLGVILTALVLLRPAAPPVTSATPPTVTAPSVERPTPDTLDRIKRATVLLDVEDRPGGAAAGSGWLGGGPGLVVTCAHVLGMKRPGAAPPGKITVTFDGGGPGRQRQVAGQRVKVLAVDPDADVAILELLAEKKLPDPLPLRMSAELTDLAPLAVVGFPGGWRPAERNGSDRPPAASVLRGALSAVRVDRAGRRRALQIQGGIVGGLSGGPVCDLDGEVVGMAARADVDEKGRLTGIGYAVPSEAVAGLLHGRTADVECDVPYFDSPDVESPLEPALTPVTVRCVDPLRKVMTVGVSVWDGHPENATRPADHRLRDNPLTLTADHSTATGTFYQPLGQFGATRWLQPWAAGTDGVRSYGPAVVISTPRPVYRAPAELKFAPTPGPRTLTLVRTQAADEYEDGEGDDRARRRLTTSTWDVSETAAEYRIDSLGMTWTANGRTEPAWPDDLDRLTREAKATSLALTFDKTGAAPPPTDAQRKAWAANEVATILQATAVPLPGRTLKPLETWTAVRDRTLSYQPDTAVPAREFAYRDELTFTLLGVREIDGKKEAVVRITGRIAPPAGKPDRTATGTLRGLAVLDTVTGLPLSCEVKAEFDLDTSARGVKKRIAVIDESRLTRTR